MNKTIILNYLAKKFNLKNDNEKAKIFSIEDVIKIAKDIDFIRKSIGHLPKNKRQRLIDLSNLNKIERFVYSSFYNFYMKKKRKESENEEFKGKINAKIIKKYISVYYSNYHFTKSTDKMISKMRHKAYYDFSKNNLKIKGD